MPANRCSTSSNREIRTEIIAELVHDNTDEIVVEHLERLRSEAVLQDSLTTWTRHRGKHTYVLLVDMNKEKAAKKVNFVRSLAEQVIDSAEKHFVLVLHYSPSSAIDSRLYPALTIGGWKQVFLDTISGYEKGLLKINNALNSHLDQNHEDVKSVLLSMSRKLIPQVLASGIFYRTQKRFHGDSFQKTALEVEKLLFAEVGGKSIVDLMNEKFFCMWIDEALPALLDATSDSLLSGRTELSMSLSIQSGANQLHERLCLFLLAEFNQWKNFDLLPLLNESEKILFYSIVQEYPAPPYRELMLHRNRGISSRLVPLPELPSCREPEFPFFFFLCTYFDELVARVEEILCNEASDWSSNLSEEKMLNRAIYEVNKRADFSNGHSSHVNNRSRVAKTAVEAAARDGGGLMEKYISQFVQWKHGLNAGHQTIAWWHSRLTEVNGERNPLAVHVVSRLHRIGKSLR